MKFLCDWKNFETTTLQNFRDIWNEQCFTDVVLATVDDQQIQAHKIVLSFGSTFFKHILMKNINHNILIYLKDTQYKDLKLIVEFLYTGQCYVEESDLIQFLSVGKDLGVIGLVEKQDNTEANIPMEDNASDVKREKSIHINERSDIAYSLPENREFGCNDCDAVYRSKKGLYCHIRTVHKGVRYNCN